MKQREEREGIGLDWNDSDYVFSNFDGTPYHPNTVSKAFSKIIKKADLPKVRLHDLRHTHATIMLKQGADPKTISERLGHSSVVITLDTYAHVLPGMQEAAALKFEEAINAGALLKADVDGTSL